MPPKATATADSNLYMMSLIVLMATADEFKPNLKSAGEELGILAQNVPRKINTVLKPFGYELKAGKVILKGQDGSGVPATTQPVQSGLRDNSRAAASVNIHTSNDTCGQAAKKRKIAKAETEKDEKEEEYLVSIKDEMVDPGEVDDGGMIEDEGFHELA